jgi:putative DNA methylase
MITGSWPIDTEMKQRLRAQKSAALASSIWITCRPRRGVGSTEEDQVGEWRDLLAELPRRISEWLPRLSQEGIVGADAVFACLGPALEIFSQYDRVERANGQRVELPEYLEQVWAAVSREALSMIFSGADATGLEEDARLTAMWLWTVAAGATDGPDVSTNGHVNAVDDETSAGKSPGSAGFPLAYDAARKIAQGLGAHLDRLSHLVEVKGDVARLRPVDERTRYLFGKDGAATAKSARRASGMRQLDMFGELSQAEEETTWGISGAPAAGKTVLDRVHQSMILFGAGRAEALRRFLVEQGVGNDAAFWGLAQSLTALYPTGTEEKRWVDGVLARKRGLGF